MRIPGSSGDPLTISRAVAPSDWDAFVQTHPDATGCHLWRWRHVFERAFNHWCEYLAARLDDRVAGVLPLVWVKSWIFGESLVSLPFLNYGGVVAETPAIARALLTEALTVLRVRSHAHLELRHRRQWFPELQAKRHKVAMLLALKGDVGEIWGGFDRKVRNQIRKAEKSRLEAVTGGTELLQAFYRVFSRNMRDLGTPVYSRSFFEQVFEQFPDRTRVVIVKRGSETAAGCITFQAGRTLEVPWASSSAAFRPLCPNHLLYWTVIRHAVANGVDTLDFGRSTPDEGTFQFKRQWGAVPSPLIWEYGLPDARSLPDLSPRNPKFDLAIRLWKKLPVSVTTLVGPSIVRGIP